VGRRVQDPWIAEGGWVMAVAFNPAKFVRDVRIEVGKVTWPSRKETLITTGLVFALSAMAAIFFFVADQVIGIGVRALFGVGF
jgi:preprotein translocase subunit SecE